MRQRPFDVLANPADTPRAIYVSGFDSALLAADTGVVVEGRMEDLQRGIDALGVLAGEGGVHVGTRAGDNTLGALKGCTLTGFAGLTPLATSACRFTTPRPSTKARCCGPWGFRM